MKTKNYVLFILILIGCVQFSFSQKYWNNITNRASTLGLEDGFTTYKTPAFELKLVNDSQTVASLTPLSDQDFDFTPGDRIKIRDKDSLYQLGDINFRIKQADGSWKSYSSAWKRSTVRELASQDNILASADITPTFPSDIPVSVKRYYKVQDGGLTMNFELKNTTNKQIEIGALGIPMIFNNILEGNTLEEAHSKNVFFDPYIGEDAGYLEVKRLSGKGPVLLVLPHENMPFEAYRPLLDDPTRRSIVFEGFYEWMPYSKAYAQDEWKGAKEWNPPTSLFLKPGEKKVFSLKFVLTDKVENIKQKLIEQNRPYAVSVPGYVLPMDVKSQLFLKYNSPVSTMEVDPKGALSIKDKGLTNSGYGHYEIQGQNWGRVRLLITYKNGLTQSINYKVIKPEKEVVSDLGNFLTTKQWFDTPGDPFHRNPSVITYDYETKKQVTQDSRAWIAGLSDEGGAGSWLAAMMKEYVEPDKSEIEKLQQFIDSTLWGGIQYKDGDKKYGVKKSIFYYEPDSLPKGTYDKDINYKTWAAWNKKGADDTGRSYNYPHVTAAYWVMYNLARYHDGLVTNHPWDWYLKQAYHTVIAMTEQAPYYVQFGQMEGSVFLFLLQDLKREGWDDMAASLEAKMKSRAEHWDTLKYPFGSEMPWDSTGQEEVYTWSDYFGYDDKAEVTLNAILAYMPTMPHWAYNGNARRYWDFLYGGKLSRIERQIHHYGSGINAIPVLDAYRNNPDFYLLKVGYGGLLGAISNITQDGFGPAAFHAFPSTLRIDYLSGDYGSGFYGYAVNTATYITDNQDLGWQVFGGNISSEKKGILRVDLTTAAKNKLYFTPEKLWLRMEAGKIKSLTYNLKTKEFTLTLYPEDKYTPKAYLRLNKEVNLGLPLERGAFVIDLDKQEKTVRFKL